MTKTLFSEFPEVSAKEWKQKIQADLKGADYNETLVFQTKEGIDIKPFYHQDTVNTLPSKITPNAYWNICQTIFVQHVDIANDIAVQALKNGAESIKFIIPEETINLNLLFKNISLDKTTVFIETLFLSKDFSKKIHELPNNQNIIQLTDVIGNLAKTGNWFSSLNADVDTFIETVKTTKSFAVKSSLYQNSGANMVQELAYTLAHLNEYFNYLDAALTTLEKSKIQVVFNTTVGSNYFFEIAKLRALRSLYGVLAQEYGFKDTCIIYTTPTKRNKTLYDYNTNMLRTTTECMSAILGGANYIYNMPYDAIYHKNNEFGDRISRNQLLILKHESNFNLVKNPSEGAYYIESVTTELAEKALKLFKNIEANQGFLSQLKSGTIQRKIKESAQKEQDFFDSGKITLLGTNKHPDPENKMANELELYPFVKTKPRKTLIEPIIEKRLAEKLEQERLKNE